ncbi:neuronal PAS domain-containing protein 2-like isoform X1 [Macrobrachium nipponense]|uniref:neuronal PAS domain-containing protein 2-like isoform X1 n=2 Tax=Macrobrachium nipponense TaxID=159736 RepID=UPI0030C8B8B2
MASKPKLPSSSREMRNIAEKMRRDKLNNYVSELASIVPLVCGSNKRIDKTSVLRLAASYIRMHNILGDGDQKKRILTTGGPTQRGLMASLEEAIGGFLLVMSSTGKVVFITEAVESFFGYTQVDLLGSSIYNVIHSEDHEILREQLANRECSRDTRRSFFCRMMEKALSRNDPSRYEIIHIVGLLKPLPERSPVTGASSPSKFTVEETDSTYSDSDNDDMQSVCSTNKIGTHMLVAFVRVVKDRPITEISLVESTQDEYITRHTMDGKILYSDHRISFVTGLMPTEVIGTSAFKYMHSEDMVWSMVAHKLMFTSTQGQGLVSYRLKCKGGSLVTLRSRGYIELNKETGQAETFVCINTVVSNKEANDEIRNQRRKLLPIIINQQSEDHLCSVPSSMPPEMLSMIEHLMDPKTLQKIIGEIDPTMKSSKAFGLNFSKESRVLKEVSQVFKTETFSPKRELKDYKSSELSDPTMIDDFFEKEEKRGSNMPQKRNSHEELCTLPTKKHNSTVHKPKADVYHQSYSPQASVPLPQLSPDTVQPILCSSVTLSNEKLNYQPNNKNIEFHSTHVTGNCHSTSGTNNMHFHHHSKSEGNAYKHYHATDKNCAHLNESYKNCRLCSKTEFNDKSSVTHSQSFDVQNACSINSVAESTPNAYRRQIVSQNTNSSSFPSSHSNQCQIYAKHASGCDFDQRNRNLPVPVPHHITYPHDFTNSYHPEQSYCSSIPEFDIKLQRLPQSQEGQLYHQCSNLLEQTQNIPHQRVHCQQEWLSKSSVSHSLAMSTNPMATNMQQLCSIPNQCMTPSADNQGASVPVMYGQTCPPSVWNTQ